MGDIRGGLWPSPYGVKVAVWVRGEGSKEDKRRRTGEEEGQEGKSNMYCILPRCRASC